MPAVNTPGDTARSTTRSTRCAAVSALVLGGLFHSGAEFSRATTAAASARSRQPVHGSRRGRRRAIRHGAGQVYCGPAGELGACQRAGWPGARGPIACSGRPADGATVGTDDGAPREFVERRSEVRKLRQISPTRHGIQRDEADRGCSAPMTTGVRDAGGMGVRAQRRGFPGARCSAARRPAYAAARRQLRPQPSARDPLTPGVPHLP